MKGITVLNAYKISDPGTEYIRWAKLPPVAGVNLEDLDAKDAENITFTYYTGKRRSFYFQHSKSKIEFVCDIEKESDLEVCEEFIREVYEQALVDVADMLGTTKSYLAERLEMHNLQKRRL